MTGLRVAILQRVLPAYRIRVFQELQQRNGWNLRIFIGEDLAGTKIRSAPSFQGLDVHRFPTSYLNIGPYILANHKGVGKALREFAPDIIVSEGESNFLSYLKAVWFRARNRKVRLVHWSLGDIPGREARTGEALIRLLKRAFLGFFDSFIVYSSYGKSQLVSLGRDREEVFVAVNVGDVEGHIKAAEGLGISKEEARSQLALEAKFIALYVGAMDPGKRLDTLLDAMALLDDGIQLVVLGRGGEENALRKKAEVLGLTNVRFCGYASGDTLLKFYISSDALVLPGRGGMVISEAMAHGLPPIVFQADGTEYDLVEHGKTGIRLKTGDAAEIAEALGTLGSDNKMRGEMSDRGRELVHTKYNLADMVRRMTEAVEFALARN